MIFKFGHPVKSGIGPVSAFPSSHLQLETCKDITVILLFTQLLKKGVDCDLQLF